MCFGPTKAEKEAAAEQRVEADIVQEEQVVERAEAKREDIQDALSARVARKGMRGGGKGRRSLYSGNTGAGFLSRFR